jgi:cysteine desulfurase
VFGYCGGIMGIYLDYNASAPVDRRVLDIMIDVYQNSYGNADSRTHDHGDKARSIVEQARKQVASLLGVNATEVFFTSGATESNNIAIQGLQDYANETGKKHIITSSIEHKAVLETVKAMKKKGFEIDIINPNPSGYVDIQAVLGKVRDDTLLVSIMHVNNETGIIQPVQELGEELSKRNVLFHVDATQSCGKLVDELRKIKYNILSFSAHKLQGPQGVGGLILRKKRYKLPPVKQIMYGGQQEHGIRPGTIPVALVAACGKACEIAEQEYIDNHEKVKLLKKALFETLDMSGVNYHFNGDQSVCIDSTANICFPGVMSEALMISAKQYCSISNGSACTSKSYSPSYVLEAMGMSVDEIENSIRVSWGAEVSEIEFRESIEQLLEVVKSLAI